MYKNRVCELFGVKYPLIQAGMVWCSGWKLARAVSDSGGLGIIGSGSMYPKILEEHLQKITENTDKPYAVNVPLLYSDIEAHFNLISKYKVPIVFTSAGNPKKWTGFLKDKGITVVHVVSSKKFAINSQEAGVDAVVAEGFEAGGHNGREETTSMCLIPDVVKAIDLPVIAAGGIATGEAMLAAMILGAEAVQIGSRFVASNECSAHELFKKAVVKATEGETLLTLKEVTPVRLMKNGFFNELMEAYARDAEVDELKSILGRGRAKRGMFEGDIENGELEIGQVASQIISIMPAKEIMEDILEAFSKSKNALTLEGRFNF
ncbi:MAG: nitronate monooxygenase [Flavobacteriales bacterium]|nr:nitronate monooxygenase [Flavobacteriales bacterium]